MNSISLSNIGRRFNKHWIFRAIDYTFEQGKSYAILGANGSGKSTLLQVISGCLSPSEGSLSYQIDQKKVAVENCYRNLVMVTPYLDLIEEFTFQEAIDFHFQFKELNPKYQKSDLYDCLNLATHKQKEVKYFSSGMKQRLKLALGFFSNVEILLLDEPTSNLDMQGEEWYNNLFKTFTDNKICIVSSNQKIEYQQCDFHLLVSDYKLKKAIV